MAGRRRAAGVACRFIHPSCNGVLFSRFRLTQRTMWNVPQVATHASHCPIRFASGNPHSNKSEGSLTSEIICSLEDVSKAIPNRMLFENARLSFYKGAKIGVLGVNGSGKSSLLKVIAGVDTDYQGKVWRKPGLIFKYLAQEPQLDSSLDVKGNVRLGLREKEALLRRFESIAEEMGAPEADFDKLLEEQATLQARIEDLDCWSLEHRVDTVMKALNLPPVDASVDSLSGGERRRVALCRMLLEEPDVLLLDEPTNHLDTASVAWLEDFLQAYRGMVITITHDRYFLDNMASFILEVDRGRLYPFKGNYSSWLEQKRQRCDMERGKEASYAQALQDELVWIRERSSSATKARTRRVEAKKQQHQGMAAKLRQLESGRILIPPGQRLGNKVITVTGLQKSINGRMLFKNLNFKLEPGSVVGVIGPNGCGKSTFLRILAGQEVPDQGSVDFGPTVNLAMVSQMREGLDDKNTVYEEVAQSEEVIQVGDRSMSTRAFVAAFNLKGSTQEKLVGSLSGGERNRVHLAKMMKSRSNVILLDEPVNDLDVDTIRSLEEALMSFPGSAIIVSHDRYFLDRVANEILAFEPSKLRVIHFDGSCSEYHAQSALKAG